jgi:hypothetical protein
VYVAILGLSVLVAVIGVGGVALSRAQARARNLQADTAEARGYAMAGVEWARTVIHADPNWRTTHSNGVWLTQDFGNGRFSVDVTNLAGALNNAETDSVVVTGTGVKGQAVQRVQVTLGALVTPYTCMATAATSGGLMSLGSTKVSGAGSVIASNVGVTAVTGTVYPDAESAGAVTGGTFVGNTTSLAAARTLPTSSVFDYYVANGTAVAYSSVPVAGGAATIQNVLLSPQSNPYGTTNGQGIYVIDCNYQNVVITNCRIVGTLVLLNAGGGTVVQGSVTWEPAVANYPCLLVQGSMTIKQGKADLPEGGAKGNLNPAGTPYPYLTGTSNTNSTDKYPSVIDGLVYVSGDLATSADPAIDNLVVGGAWSAGGTMTLNAKALYQTNPPPGFRTVNMGPLAGTWKQVVN